METLMTALDDTRPETDTGLIHAGGGFLIAMGQICPLFPGLLPFLALTVVFALPLLVPFVALGIVAAVVGGPPYLVWRLVRR
jgi:hypothetical protein